MVKIPPNRLARGPEAEPEVQPLIAQLRQDRAEAQAAADASVLRVIAEFTGKISEAIIAKNKTFATNHSEFLAVPTNANFKGVGIDCQLLLDGVKQWARNNGLDIRLEDIRLEEGQRCHGYDTANYWIDQNLKIHYSKSGLSHHHFQAVIIHLSWEAV